MSVTLSGYTARCEAQTADFGLPFKAASGSTLRVPAGTNLRFEFLFKKDSEIVSVANFASCTLLVFDKARTGGSYFSQVVTGFDDTTTAATWADGTQQHCAFAFVPAETELASSIFGTEYYLLVVAKDVGGVVLAEAWTRLIILKDNYPSGEAAIQPGNIVPAGVSYDAAGRYALETEDGIYYKWTDGGANDSGVINGVETVTVSNSNFIAQRTTQSITGITRSGATATATKAAHGYLDTAYVTIAGAVQTEYNGTFAVSNVTGSTFDFTVAGTPATPATGTLTGTTNTMLTGTAGQLVTAVVRKSPYLTAEEVQALINSVLALAYGQTVFGGLAEPEGVQTAPRWSHYTQIDGDNVVVRDWIRAVGTGTINTGWI